MNGRTIMRTEDILKLARQQGLPETMTRGVFLVNADDLGRLLAAEREACAKVCDEAHELMNSSFQGAAEVIRARG
jgi:predicted ThiF/HesA family dinucleotide-utilizing enzyme